MSNQNRRTFMGDSMKAAAAITAAGLVSPLTLRAQDGAAKDFRVGCIGMGGMGCGDARDLSNFASLAAVCDVDTQRMEKALEDEKIGRDKPDSYKDYRKILDRDDIDIVSVVTTDHWHVKICIEALQAGKHVFCQKPLTLTLEENQLIRDACKKYADRVFMVGTQQRCSRDKFLRAVNMVQKGLLGEVKRVTVGINGGQVGGPFKTSDVPKSLDWDMWLGQAPKVEYIKERCHYQFRWWYEYSGGKFTDWGAHHIDIALWALGLNGDGMGPMEVDGRDAAHPVPFSRGYPNLDNCYNTSQNFSVICKYEDGTEVNVTSRGPNGILFEGTKGRIFVNREKITGKPIEEGWDEGQYEDAELRALYKDKPHEWSKKNMMRCIREGGLPVSDVYTHVQAMTVCHLCAIAARLQRVIKWDPKNEKILGDELEQSFFARTPRKGFEIPRV